MKTKWWTEWTFSMKGITYFIYLIWSNNIGRGHHYAVPSNSN